MVVLAALVLAGGVVSAAAQEAGAGPSAQGKKRCKIVKKKVHGKIRLVRVCHTVKPTPSLPSKVSVTLDSAHAASASIRAETGGTVTAGGATLTVPPGAIAETTSVTMTPVTKLGGLRGRVLGAVQFQPDGLELLKPVTLTIHVSSTSRLEAFSYAGNGSDFHFYPFKAEAGKATLTLFHFSGYGVGEGLPSPSVDPVRKELNTVVKPAVESAKRDPRIRVFEHAAKLSVLWMVEVSLLPPAQSAKFAGDVDAVAKDIAVALRGLADDAHTRCIREHDILSSREDIESGTKLVELMLDLPGLAGAIALHDAWSYARDQQMKCERFELDFKSTIMWRAGDGHVTSDAQVKGLMLNPQNKWTNQQDLDYFKYDFGPTYDCSLTTQIRLDEPFKANIVSLERTSKSTPPKIVVHVTSGKASEIMTTTCGDQPPFTITGGFWHGGIVVLHTGDSFNIDDWDYVGTSLFARRTYTGSMSVSDGSVTEQTTFELRHTPE